MSGGRGKSRETEDSRNPWRLTGLSSKKDELWLILAKTFELHLFPFLCSLKRSVLKDLDSAFHFFFVCICFSVENLEKIGVLMAWTRISVLWQWQSAEFCLL